MKLKSEVQHSFDLQSFHTTLEKRASKPQQRGEAYNDAWREQAKLQNVKAIWHELYEEVYEQVKQAKGAAWSGFMSIPKGKDGQDGEDVTGIGDLHDKLEHLLRVIEGYKE